jgi:RimJ/RimL family protein N-acetyltransferase
MMIRNVEIEDLSRVRNFLEAHVETSLFLLSNLALFGPRLGDHWNSANYRLAEQDGQVAAVFALTRRGNLLVQAGGRTELAESIVEACESEPIEIRGVLGEWPLAEAIWNLLRADPWFEPGQGSRDVLYRFPLIESSRLPEVTLPQGFTVRPLQAGDFEPWERLNTAYLAELHMPLPVVDEAHEAEFARRARARWWWGAFFGSELVATVGLNAAYGVVGQVGGVFTRPAERKKGVARAAMGLLMREAREYHRFEKLILFTGEDNQGARALYESLGFESIGAFGLLFGSRRPHPRVQTSHKWQGSSGELYTYDVHPWPVRLSPGPGNFIFANSLGAGLWRPVLIGESADLATLSAHERLRSSSGRQAPTHVHVRLNFNPAPVRRSEVNDLTARWLSTQRE